MPKRKLALERGGARSSSEPMRTYLRWSAISVGVCAALAFLALMTTNGWGAAQVAAVGGVAVAVTWSQAIVGSLVAWGVSREAVAGKYFASYAVLGVAGLLLFLAA
jgi:hypothetical protein